MNKYCFSKGRLAEIQKRDYNAQRLDLSVWKGFEICCTTGHVRDPTKDEILHTYLDWYLEHPELVENVECGDHVVYNYEFGIKNDAKIYILAVMIQMHPQRLKYHWYPKKLSYNLYCRDQTETGKDDLNLLIYDTEEYLELFESDYCFDQQYYAFKVDPKLPPAFMVAKALVFLPVACFKLSNEN